MKRAFLAALALPLAAAAQNVVSPDAWNAAGPLPGEMGNPVIGAPLGANDPPRAPEAAPPPPVSAPVPLAELRGKLIGKPVFGVGSGRIGTVSDVVVDAANRVSNITVQVEREIDPDRAHLPVPWAWVRGQLDQPTLVVQWDPALVAWLTEPGRSRRTAAAEPPPPAERAAWENATAAQLEEWRARIDQQSRSMAQDDTGLRQLQLSYGAASHRLERLRDAEPDAWPTEQAKLQAELDDLGEAWTELAEAR